jgi:hypothetical protein
MAGLLAEAEVVACGGGVSLTQALTLGRVCVASDLGGADQPERIAACARAGMVEPAPLEAMPIADAVTQLAADAVRRERMRQAIDAAGLRNGLGEALEALAPGGGGGPGRPRT